MRFLKVIHRVVAARKIDLLCHARSLSGSSRHWVHQSGDRMAAARGSAQIQLVRLRLVRVLQDHLRCQGCAHLGLLLESKGVVLVIVAAKHEFDRRRARIRLLQNVLAAQFCSLQYLMILLKF